MNRKKLFIDRNLSLNELSERLSGQQDAPGWGFILCIIVYFAFTVLIRVISMTDARIVISGTLTPVSSFVGVFAMFQNVILILLTILYEKKGFITCVALIVLGFAGITFNIIVFHIFSGITGYFSGLVTLLTVIFLHIYTKRLKKYQQEMSAQAVTDSLTGLPNRRAGVNMVQYLAEQNEPFALAVFDIKNFKSINETLGHSVGNNVLVEVAKRLRNIAESSSTGTKVFISRHGGDEFAVIIRNFESEADILETIRAYDEAIRKKIDLDGFEHFISGRCGYTLFPSDSADPDVLFANADNALFTAKHSTDSNILRYTPEMSRSSERTLELERMIRKALEDDRVYFNLQPQYDINHKLCGFESLARMRDADGNFVSPGEFIPAAEKAGIIDQVDRRVIHRSAEFFGEIIRETGCDNITLSVNVSVLHLLRKDFISEMQEILNKYNIPPHMLEIEITESVMIDSAEKALSRINDIKNMGMKIAIDDFGTGYSSLSYLNSFPADVLKVDKSFIDQMNTSASGRQYVSAIISIGHIMNFSVISEGVEKPDQLDTLRDIGCDMIQGFIWGRPLDPAAAEDLVKESVSK